MNDRIKTALMICRPTSGMVMVFLLMFFVAGIPIMQPPSAKNQNPFSDGMASFYGNGFHGRKTANGETYNQYDYTCAHRTFPFNSLLYVTNLKNSRSVIVRVSDRGPFAHKRIIDLSYGAAQFIGMIDQGVAKVRVQLIKPDDILIHADSIYRNIRRDTMFDLAGNGVRLSGQYMKIWESENMMHSMMMEHFIAEKFSLDDVFVHLLPLKSGKMKCRLYANISKETGRNDSLIGVLRKNGFSMANIVRLQ